MNAKWIGDIDHYPPWAAVNVKRTAPGFGKGYTIELGIDNVRPDEFFCETEARIANRFECETDELILEIIG